MNLHQLNWLNDIKLFKITKTINTFDQTDSKMAFIDLFRCQNRLIIVQLT